MRRGGLGRGLGALIPPDSASGAGSIYRELPIAAIEANPHQPRSVFDEEALNSLTASVQAMGVLQPILVREVGEGKFQLVAGERRWRAARRAGLQTIPALVQDVSDVASLERAVVENLHRQDLNPLEEAGAYQQLIEDFGYSHEQLAGRVGKSRTSITNTIRLLGLPAKVQQLVVEGLLTAGHARALLGLASRHEQEELAVRVVEERLTVRALEEMVRKDRPGTPAKAAPKTPPASDSARSAAMLELEEMLGERYETRVRVEMSERKGRVVIEFATLGDLERIYRIMLGPTEGEPPDLSVNLEAGS